MMNHIVTGNGKEFKFAVHPVSGYLAHIIDRMPDIQPDFRRGGLRAKLLTFLMNRKTSKTAVKKVN